MISEVFNIDNIELMSKYPDKYFDLAVVDPPYGLGDRLSDGGGKLKNTPMAELYRGKEWDVIPNEKYWVELFRISKNQIVFGANYFLEYLPSSRGVVCWDKNQYMPTLSSFELVWTSFDRPAKIFKARSTDLNRFHPTQKPIKLYQWIYHNYLPQGGKVLDTHLGSGSNRIAADMAGNIDFTACELDKEYFDAQEKRWREYKSQLKMF